MDVLHYVDTSGKDVFQAWLDRLRDTRGKIAVLRRIDRMAACSLGDHAFCRDGVWELRIDCGPGYRVYYAWDGDRVVVLLAGGDKATQARDIARAIGAWNDYKRRIRDGEALSLA